MDYRNPWVGFEANWGEEVGYKGNLRYQLFDASDEIYIERIDANQICFLFCCGRKTLIFSGRRCDAEVTFMDPGGWVATQESVSRARHKLRYKVHLKAEIVWSQIVCRQNSIDSLYKNKV